MQKEETIDLTNVSSAMFCGRNTYSGVYVVTEKYQYHGHVFLTLAYPGQDISPTITIGYAHTGAIDVEEGDKIEFDPMIDYKTGEEVCEKFFENENDVVIVSRIQYWKPNVVYMEGWERLNRPQPQTQFAPRPRG